MTQPLLSGRHRPDDPVSARRRNVIMVTGRRDPCPGCDRDPHCYATFGL